MLAITTAQVIFSIALGFVTLLVTAFTLFVIRTTFWADRWYPNGKPISGAEACAAGRNADAAARRRSRQERGS